MKKNKIALEYTNTSEIEAKRDIAVREANVNAHEAYIKLYDKFKELLNKSNVKFHYADVNCFGDTSICETITAEEFLKKYGPNGKLFKISNKETKKFKYSIGGLHNRKYVQDEAMCWFSDNIDEDYKKAEKFLKRKTIKNIIAEIKKVEDENRDNICNIKKHYDAMIEKAQQIQQICADYKDMNEFIIAIRKEAKKLGYFACLKNNSFEFHKDIGNKRYANAITAYATLPYSKNKEGECIIFTNELFEQVMQPLHDALKVDTSWEDKYKDLFYFNKMKIKVNVHVCSGANRYYRHPAKEFSIKNFNEINFKNWLKNVKVSEYSHLTSEVLKKARSV